MQTFRIRTKGSDDLDVMVDAGTPAEALNIALDRESGAPCHVSHAQGRTWYVSTLTNLGNNQHTTGRTYIVTDWTTGEPRRGRPPGATGSARADLSARVDQATMAAIKAHAEANSISIGRAIDALIMKGGNQ